MLLYIGDGRSPANLMGTDAFRSLVEYIVVRPCCRQQLRGRAAVRWPIAGRFGESDGRKSYTSPSRWSVPNEAEKITDARAKEENCATRRQRRARTWQTGCGPTVYWPTAATLAGRIRSGISEIVAAVAIG